MAAERQAHILVVEDEPLSRDVIVRHLELAGHRVSDVGDGLACMAWLAAGHPCDLVLLDIAMPRMNGLDTLRAIRRRYSPDSLPVIVVSALVDSDDVVAGLDAGANDYVVKPVNFRVLSARVQACLRMASTVSLLVEAERQRVMIETLTRSAEKLGVPLKRVIDTLELAARNTLNDEALQRDLNQVMEWVDGTIAVIAKLKSAGQASDLSYVERLEILSDGSSDGTTP